LYAGAAPSLADGVFQMNVRVPSGIAAGSVSITISAGGIASAQDVQVAVK
jgi:uncharacterized protein (TIGR03437 family)